MSVPFWVHFVIVFIGGSAFVNPTEICFFYTAQYSGGDWEFVFWLFAIALGAFMIFYGIPLADAIKDNDKFVLHAVVITLVFVGIGVTMAMGGFFTVDTWRTSVWIAMIWGSMIVSLAKWEQSNA
jgi:hypothetical protein